jgi:hypothetical protein
VKLQAVRKQQLEACLSALAKLDEKAEGYVISMLTQRIHELNEAISKAEQYVGCFDPRPSAAYHVRETQEGVYERKSCSELTHLYISLLRRNSLLGRKDVSPFSRSSEEEKAERRATAEALGKVKNILDSKCSDMFREDVPSGEDRPNSRIRHQ